LYKSLLYRLMKETGTHELPIDQMIRLFRDHLGPGRTPQLDALRRIRLDDVGDGIGSGVPYIEPRSQACDFSCDALSCVLACPTGALSHDLKSKEEVQVFRAVGCGQCHHTGYRGRTGIYELVEVDETLRNMIYEGRSEHEIEKQARGRSQSIWEDGVRKVLAGQTSVEEVLRVIRAD